MDHSQITFTILRSVLPPSYLRIMILSNLVYNFFKFSTTHLPKLLRYYALKFTVFPLTYTCNRNLWIYVIYKMLLKYNFSLLDHNHHLLFLLCFLWQNSPKSLYIWLVWGLQYATDIKMFQHKQSLFEALNKPKVL